MPVFSRLLAKAEMTHILPWTSPGSPHSHQYCLFTRVRDLPKQQMGTLHTQRSFRPIQDSGIVVVECVHCVPAGGIQQGSLFGSHQLRILLSEGVWTFNGLVSSCLVLMSSHFHPHFYSISTWCLLSNWREHKGFQNPCASREVLLQSLPAGEVDSDIWRYVSLEIPASNASQGITLLKSLQCNCHHQWWKSAFLVCLELVIICGMELYDKTTQAVTHGKY